MLAVTVQVAKLLPFDVDTSPRHLGGIWQGRVHIAEDFDGLP